MIYFIEDLDAGRVKVGYSAKPLARLRGMTTANSGRLAFYAVLPGSRAGERIIQRRLRAFHLRGEWFDFSDDCRSAIDLIVRRRTASVLRQVAFMARVNQVGSRAVDRKGVRRGARPDDASLIGRVLRAMRVDPFRVYRNEELILAADTSPRNLRTIMCRMVRRGYVQRLSAGHFRLIDPGESPR